MHIPQRKLRVVLASLLLTLCMTCVSATTWLDADIGAPTAAGGHSENGSAITVTGAGTGDTTFGGDQLHYTYTTAAAGDVDVIARVTAFTGAAHGRAGIMLRASNTATATTANAVFAFQDAADGKHNFFYTARDEASTTGLKSSMTTRMTLPVWLRIVRIGKHFAVYKSPDGNIWSMITNNSGWQFTPTGAFEVGFFVASGNSAVTSSATFDNITIAAPHLGYSTSWFGDTFGGNVDDGHVSNWISALWVAGDGTCYTNSFWDEGGEASKIYKDGQVVRAFSSGNASACEGSITSDGTNVFLATGHALNSTDMQGTPASTLPVYLTIDPFDATRSVNIISGLAAANNEVYISDSRENKIRVAHKTLTRYYTAGNSLQELTTQTIDTTGVPNAAPAIVYQSQRLCDYLPYVIPGFTPSATYTVRCHFAEFFVTQAGQRLMTISASGATPVQNYDIFAAAGGQFKPAVLDIPNVHPDASGKITVIVSASPGNTAYGIVINGLEVLNSGGSQVFAVNCCGPAAGGFQSEVNEIPERAFAFTRPGPMVTDTRGDLWIIQEANDFPIGSTMTTKYTGAIFCYHPNGTYAGKQITDVANPAALAYDTVNDRLLVADNGTNQQIRIYTNLNTTPTFANTFGVQGGIYAGTHPGLVNDPASGGYARFYGMSGVGIDAQGNIYVSCGSQGSDLRKYTSAGTLVWMLNGLIFCCCPDIDPDSDGANVYGVYYHASMDYTQTTPGKEWSYTGYNWNPMQYGAAPREAAAQSILRRVGPNRALIHYTSGQGLVDYIGIFRYVGETAIPCGQIRNGGMQVWIDLNGDGLETPDEDVNGTSPGGISTFCVDTNGDIWLACLSDAYPVLHHFFLKGMTAQGAPIYGVNAGDYEDIPYPGPQYSTWAQKASVYYDADRDTMYLLGPACARGGDQSDVFSYLARYDYWSTGNRTARWFITLPDPTTDVNCQYEVSNLVHQWVGMDVATDKLFIASLFGQINVYNASTGVLERILNPGPEVSGSDAWEDAAMGLTAFKRANGEFVVFSENSGYGGKANMYRIPPSGGANIPPVVSISYPGDGAVLTAALGTIAVSANAVDDDGSIARVEIYKDGNLLGTPTTRPYSVNWTNITPGTYAFYAKAYDNLGAVTTSATTHATIVSTPIPPTGLQLWLKADDGVATAGSTVTGWADRSGTGKTITITSAPTYTTATSGLNNMPSVNFDGIDDYLTFNTMTDMKTVFWVLKDARNPITTNCAPLLGDATTYDFCYGYVAPGKIFDPTYCPLNTLQSTLRLNGMAVDGTQTDMPVNWAYLSFQAKAGATMTASNFSNDRFLTGRLWYGGLAELIVYNTALSAQELSLVESYLQSKYLINKCATPTFTPNGGTYTSSQTVTLSCATSGATLRYTTDGSTPTETNGIVGTSVTISQNTTLQAIAYKAGLTDSAIASATYTIYSPPTTGLQLWLKADSGVTTAGSSVTGWTDCSGTGKTITINSAPTYTTANSALNNMPSVNFDGNDDYVTFNTISDIKTVFWVLQCASNPITNNNAPLLGDTTAYDFAYGYNTPGKMLDWNYASPNLRNGLTRLNGAVVDSTITDMPQTWSFLSMQTQSGTTVKASNFSNDRNLSGRRWYGGLAEVLIYNTALTAQQISQVENYLQVKYSLPTVTLTVPSEGTDYVAPATVSLTANTTVLDGTISKVEFYQGTSKLGENATSPYTYTWTGVAAGSYSLTAKVYDNNGGVSVSTPVHICVLPNQVKFTGTAFGTSPAWQQGCEYDKATDGNVNTFFSYSNQSGGYTGLDLGAGNTIPINTIRYFARTGLESRMIGGKFQGSNTSQSSGYTDLCTITTKPPSRMWVLVTITDPTPYRYIRYLGPDGTYCDIAEMEFYHSAPPTVTLTAPTNNQVFNPTGQTVTITATASDTDGISKVEFYNGATLLNTVSTSPYSYAWTSVAEGDYTITAKAYDIYNVSTTSSAVTFYSTNSPTVSLTAPANNAQYIAPATVSLTATASDTESISKVEFYQGATLLGTSTSSPYTCTWTSVAMGNYVLTAKAYDNHNQVTTSSAVNISVWGTSDIGTVGITGSASYTSPTFTVSGAGAGVTGTADALRFVYQQLSGNTTIIARVATAASATTTERAGVMMRKDLTAGSIEASSMYKPTSTYYVYFLRRTTANGSTSSTTSTTAAAPPYWVKLVRSSNTLSAFMSANGSSWTAVGSGTTVTMTDPIYVGLAVTSGSTSAAKTVTFDNVSITQP